MAVEHACVRAVGKPWGSHVLWPWSEIDAHGGAIGELWFQRPDRGTPEPALLLKLLFTKEALSIQVHPDDTFARSIGLKRGKTEAWYILSATPDAKVALGLKRQLTSEQLRAAIEDGSIADLVAWRKVLKDDVIVVPAGTIHAIGAGLVIAEIQQRSDSTFRLFDYGRQRDIHIERAVAASNAGPAQRQFVATRLNEARTLLAATSHFVLERIDLAPRSNWEIDADEETWILVIDGDAQFGQISAFVGESIFVEGACANISVGSGGLRGLLAYSSAEPRPDLLRNLDGQSTGAWTRTAPAFYDGKGPAMSAPAAEARR
jgi:mannose-6-phosphate isomerase